MKTTALILFINLLFQQTMFAKTFKVPYNQQVDYVNVFETQCKGQTASDLTMECQWLASALKVEALENLVYIEALTDPETKSIFKSFLKSSDLKIVNISYQYLNRFSESENSFLSKFRTFLFGNNIQDAIFADDLLRNSEIEIDRLARDDFREAYPSLIYESSKIGSDEFIAGLALNFLMDLNNSWEEKIFPQASRCLIADKLPLASTDQPQIMGTGYCVVGNSIEAFNHSKMLFAGQDPLPPINELEARQRQIDQRMQELMEKIMQGDYSVMPEYQALAEETQKNQTGIYAYSILNIKDNSTARIWIDTEDMVIKKGIIFNYNSVLDKTYLTYLSQIIVSN